MVQAAKQFKKFLQHEGKKEMQKKKQWYKTAQSPSVYQLDLQVDIPDTLYKIIEYLNNLG